MSLRQLLFSDFKKRPRLASGVLVAVSLVGLVVFQNCGSSARLTLNGSPSTEALFSSTLRDRFCGNNQASSVDTLNVIFVVDMSGSNVECAPNLGAPHNRSASDLPGRCFSAPSRPGVQQTEISATDPSAARIRIVEEFLRQECGNANTNSRFAVVGFSDRAISQGTCNKELLKPSGDPGLSSQLGRLSDVQNTWLNYYYGPYINWWNNQALPEPPLPPDPMFGTQYAQGLGCAKSIIESKAASFDDPSDKTKNSYFVIFLTDGLPSDAPYQRSDPYNREDFATRKTSITNLVSSMVGLARDESKAQSVSVLPLFYGVNELNALGAQAQIARTQVSEMMASMAAAGETNQPREFQDVAQIRLCEYMNAGRRTQTDVLRFGVVNLTARLSNGKLMPDSDMDGFTDADELQFGFDPTQARSDLAASNPRTQLIDGLCPRGVPFTSCPRIVNCRRPNLSGIGSCDLQVFSVSGADGVDSDKDGIPDMIEIIKGMRPNTNDASSDTDNDKIPAYLEIQRGSDPNVFDSDVDPKKLVQYTHSLSSKVIPDFNCPLSQKPYQLEVTNMPLVKTLAVTPDFSATGPAAIEIYEPLTWYPHAAGDNVILVYYLVGQSLEAATSSIPSTLWGKYFHINYETGFVRAVPGFDRFRVLGTIDGVFRSAPRG